MKTLNVISCLGLLLPCLSMAQSLGFSGAAQPDSQKSMTSGGSTLMLMPFKYVGPVTAEKSTTEPVIQRPPSQQKIVDLNAAGDYAAVGTEGLALMLNEKVDEELQLIVANSLAWTGRTKEAVPAYQGLTKGKYVNEATVGLANIIRWRGRDDQALPLYQSVLSRDSSNADALEGVEMASRELAARTTIGVAGSSDSGDTQRRSGFINHRWRDGSGVNIFEIETSGVRDWIQPTTPQVTQQEITARYQSLDLALKPSLELSHSSSPNPAFFGTARVKLLDDQITLSAGLVNWGRIANNPTALSSGLSARYFGANATQAFTQGTVTGRFDFYDISDGNAIVTTGLNFNSAWRPLGSNVKPFAGFETRSAKVSSKNYWSPSQGSGTAFGGLIAEWGESEWNFFSSAQLGTRLYGDAGASWSVSAGGKRWLSTDVALNLNLWSMASWRDNATYRAQSINVNLEKLWR
jgi:hypothetical protein